MCDVTSSNVLGRSAWFGASIYIIA